MIKRDFPGFENCYLLTDPNAMKLYRGNLRPHPPEWAFSRGEAITIGESLQVSWMEGGAVPSNIIWTTVPGPIVIHECIVELLEMNKFKGWAVQPVSLTTKAGEELAGYYAFLITGRCGPIDLTRSHIELNLYPGGWFPEFVGHYFDPETWDGSEFFMELPDCRGNATGTRFVTKDVVEVLKGAKIRNLRFERLTEVVISPNIYKFGLDYLMPPDFDKLVNVAYRTAGVARPHGV